MKPKKTRALSYAELDRKVKKLSLEKDRLQNENTALITESQRVALTHDGAISSLQQSLGTVVHQNAQLYLTIQKFSSITPLTPLWNALKMPISRSDSQYWFGFGGFDGFYNEVKPYVELSPYVSSYRHPTELLSYLLVFLRKGFEFVMMEKLLDKYRTDCTLKGMHLSKHLLSLAQSLVHFMDLLTRLKPWAEREVALPSILSWASLTCSELMTNYPRTLFFFVDGTVIKKWRSGDTKIARAEFNVKHNTPAYVFFLLVSSKGTIHLLSNIRLGSTHDHTHWKQSDIVEKLARAYPSIDYGAFLYLLICFPHPLGYKYAIAGDKAYPNITRPKNFLSYVTMTADAETDDGGVEGKDYFRDPDISPFRCVVERSIGTRL